MRPAPRSSGLPPAAIENVRNSSAPPFAGRWTRQRRRKWPKPTAVIPTPRRPISIPAPGSSQPASRVGSPPKMRSAEPPRSLETIRDMVGPTATTRRASPRAAAHARCRIRVSRQGDHRRNHHDDSRHSGRGGRWPGRGARRAFRRQPGQRPCDRKVDPEHAGWQAGRVADRVRQAGTRLGPGLARAQGLGLRTPPRPTQGCFTNATKSSRDEAYSGSPSGPGGNIMSVSAVTNTSPVTGEPMKPHASRLDEKLKGGPGRLGMGIFAAALAIGTGYAGFHLLADLSEVHTKSIFPFVLLGIALLVALGFEFVNGFHDTANAVATVIYIHTLDPHVAVAWSGLWNFIDVLVSTGGVAFGIISLLPVELILQVGC